MHKGFCRRMFIFSAFILLGFFVLIEPKNATAVGESEANLIADGDMSADGVELWGNYGLPIKEKVLDATKDGGTQVLHFSSSLGSAGVQQLRVPVIPGKTYEFSYDIKVTNGLGKIILSNTKSHIDFESLMKFIRPQNGGVWVTNIRRFIAPENSNNFRVVFVIEKTSAVNGEAYLDNVTVVEVDPNNPIADGNMAGLSPNLWRSYGTPIVKEKVLENGETQVMHIVNLPGGAGIQRLNLPVITGRKYELSYDYKVISGRLDVRLGNHDSNSDFEQAIQFNGRTNGNWVTRTREFIAPDTNDLRLVMVVRTGEAYLDNISLRELPADPPAHQGLVYENGVDYFSFGDSLTEGYNFDSNNYYTAYPSFLSQNTNNLLNDQNGTFERVGGSGSNVNLDNGCPWRQLIAQYNESKYTEKVNDTDIVTIWIGINDVLERAKYGGQAITSFEDFRAGYLELIQAIKNTNAQAGREISILVGTLHNFTRLPVENLSLDDEAITSYINGYNVIIRDIAAQEGLIVVDFDSNDSPMYRHEAQNGGLPMYQADGIHPNALGQQLITERWWATIQTLF